MISGQSSSALKLSAVGQNETGRYTCQVSHRLGTREVMFDHFLSIQGAYNTPYSHVYKICGLMKPYIHQRCYVCNNQLLLHDEAIHQRKKVVNILFIDRSINGAGALGS